MLECTVKRTHKFWLAFFLVAFVAQGVFLTSSLALADRWGGTDPDGTVNQQDLPTPTSQGATGTNTTNQSTTNSDAGSSCSAVNWFTNFPTCIGAAVLNALTDAMAWLANGAAGLFVWVVQPENISGPTGLLNKASIYELWKFIRDFFNVFFILILLLSAFATVFQVENFSIRKIFLNILLAALVINFSFPITRFLIDITNVPMYYFLNAILPGTDGGLGFTKIYLSSTGMAGIKLSAAVGFTKAFLNVVFMFLFAISLLVLAVMFLIRLIALTLLLVLSPIGFAASLMPGFQGAGSKWWEEFWRYSLFGPSAALMLLVAMRFQNELASDGTIETFNRTLTTMSSGSAASSAMALVAFYIIPLVLIWSAIGMANKSSIAGAGLVVGLGYGAAKKVGGWGKKMVVGGTKAILPTNVAKGVATGVKDGLKGGKLFGLKVMPKGLTPKELKKKGEEREAYWKGVGSGGFEGGDKAKMKLETKRQYEIAKEMKENNDSNSNLIKDLEGSDKDRSAAAAMVLTDRKAIKTSDHLEKAIKSLSDNTKEIAEVIEKADGNAMDGMDEAKYRSIRQSTRLSSDVDLQKQLDGRLVKEGNAKILVDYELGGAEAPATAQQIETAVNRIMKDMKSAKDIAKQESLFNHQDYGFWAISEIQRQSVNNQDRRQAIKKASSEEGTSVGSMI